MKYSIFFLFVFMIQVFTFSQSNFTFDFDYAYFRAEENKIFVELYYAFNQEELKLVNANGSFEIKGRIILDVYSEDAGKNVIMKDFYIPQQIKDSSDYQRHAKLTGQINIALDPGSYKFIIKACDFHDTSKCFDMEENIVLNEFNDNSLSSSAIQLSSGINKSNDKKQIFYKNTLEVIPNPSGLFGNNLSNLYYYSELYNLKKEFITDLYSIEIKIVDSDGKEMINELKQYRLSSDSKVEYGLLDVSKLPSGKYLINMCLIDDKAKEVYKTFKEFWIFNSSITQEIQNYTDIEKKYLASEYPNMNEKQVDDEFEKAIYIMTQKNREVYNNLKDIDKKKLFMFSFWDALDPNKLTVESEFKSDYMKKVEFSNANFREEIKEGWKTDRGRIYCIYGKYDDIERFSYEGATKAYEIWTYNTLQGGVIFVFIDESAGYGNYVLAHSTAQNEIFDEDWRERLKVK